MTEPIVMYLSHVGWNLLLQFEAVQTLEGVTIIFLDYFNLWSIWRDAENALFAIIAAC